MSLPSIIKKIDKETGQLNYYVNPAKRFIRPYWLNSNPEQIVLAANGVSGPVPFVVDEALGHFEIYYMVCQSTGPFTFRIVDEGRNYWWSNREIHVDTAAGTAQRPFIFPETYFLNTSGGTRQLTISCTDISGAANTIRMVLVGRRFVYREAPEVVWRKFESYYAQRERTNLFFLTTELPITALVPGVANAQNFDFWTTSDAYFEAIKLTYATFPPNTALDIRLWEFGSGRTFLPANTRTDINNMWGNSQFPSIPPESYLFDRDYRLRGDVVNTDVANCNVFLTIIGRRIKYPEEVMR